MKNGTLFQLNEMVQYWYNGWRTGVLVSLHRNNTASIRPFGKAGKARCRRVKIQDLRPCGIADLLNK